MAKSTQAASKSKGFDISTRYAQESVAVPIMDPTDLSVDTGARIVIRSLYSEEAQASQQEHSGKIIIVDGKVDTKTLDFAASLFEQTLAVTVGWEHIEIDGKPLVFSKDAARKLYTDPRTAWVQKQIQAAYLDIGRFFEKRGSN